MESRTVTLYEALGLTADTTRYLRIGGNRAGETVVMRG
jgi:hypothetical protein